MPPDEKNKLQMRFKIFENLEQRNVKKNRFDLTDITVIQEAAQ